MNLTQLNRGREKRPLFEFNVMLCSSRLEGCGRCNRSVNRIGIGICVGKADDLTSANDKYASRNIAVDCHSVQANRRCGGSAASKDPRIRVIGCGRPGDVDYAVACG